MTRQDRGRERTQLVVEAAGRAIAELGLRNVRVADIAERARMTPGHVTYYFPSKTELLMLAIRRSEEALAEQAQRELWLIDDPWDRLTRLLHLAAAKGRGDEGWDLWFQVWALAATDPGVAAVHAELDERWMGLLRGVIDHGQERGVFAVTDVTDAAEIISAVIDGLSVQLSIGSDRIDHARLIDLALRTCRALLTDRPA